MIFYAAIWIVIGIALAAISYHTVLFFILQGCVALASIVIFTRKNESRKVIFFIAGLLLLGMNYFELRYYYLTDYHLPTALIKKAIPIEGVVTEIPNQNAQGVQLLLQWQIKEHPLIRLNWYNPHPAVYVGDHWQLTVSLKPSWGLHNFGAFDYQQWLIFHGISATGSVVGSSPNALLKRGKQYVVARWRERLLLLVQQAVKNPDIVGLITALTVGSHALIEAMQWPVFQRTGTNHLMAISGLHIGIVAGFGFLLMGLVGRCCSRLLLYVPLQSLQAMAAIAAAVIYGVMAGFSLPTQRAVMMVVVVMLALLCRRTLFLWQRFVFAFCIVVILDPLSFFSVSLWMSFGSVFWIAYVNSARLKSYKKLMAWWRLQCALFIGLVPLTLIAFNQISFIGILANLIAVPWVSFLIVPLCLLAAIMSWLSKPCAIVLFHLSGWLMTPLWHYLLFLSQQSWAVWAHVISQRWVIALGMIGALLLLVPRGFPGRYFGLFLWLPLFFYKPALPQKHELWLTVLDVGQGLSVLIQTQHHNVLYDAGPKSYFGFDAGESVVVPYMQYRGLSKLDTMMISHGDNDHIGGAYAVLRDRPVQEIITSVPNKFSGSAKACYRGQHWQWDGAQFDVLWPLPNTPYQDNNSSCVLRVTEGPLHVLLTGDIEQPTEQWLVANDPSSLAADILVAPHHGSITSSSQPFIDLIKPKVVIFATGFYNRYHFPSSVVVARYMQLGAKSYNTALNGAVFIKINNKMIKTVKFATMAGY